MNVGVVCTAVLQEKLPSDRMGNLEVMSLLKREIETLTDTEQAKAPCEWTLEIDHQEPWMNDVGCCTFAAEPSGVRPQHHMH